MTVGTIDRSLARVGKKIKVVLHVDPREPFVCYLSRRDAVDLALELLVLATRDLESPQAADSNNGSNPDSRGTS